MLAFFRQLFCGSLGGAWGLIMFRMLLAGSAAIFVFKMMILKG